MKLNNEFAVRDYRGSSKMANQNNEIFLSVIIPSCNEEANIAFTLEEVIAYLSSKDLEWELTVVDDGSSDNTYQIVKSYERNNRKIKIFRNEVNKGKGYSVKRGMLASTGKYRLFMDADNSTRIREIDNFLKAAEGEGADIVIASRRMKGARLKNPQPLHRRFLSFIYRSLSRMFLFISVSDYNCGFKLFSKESAENIFNKLIMDRWSFDTEVILLAKKSGYKIKECPVTWEHKGTSKVRPLRDGIRSFIDLLSIKKNDILGKYDQKG